MPALRTAVLAALAAAAASTWSQPGQPLGNAVARPGCTQEDFPAVEIVLSPRDWSGLGRPTPPYLRMEIAGVPPGDAARLDFVAPHRRGAGRTLARAEWHDGSNPRPVWLGGTVVYRQHAQAMSVQGSYRVCGETGQCVEGSFEAPWRVRAAHCG